MKKLLREISIIFIVAFVFGACSPQKRLANIVAHNPHLATVSTITKEVLINDIDTFYSAGQTIDTQVFFIHDSLYVRHDKLSLSLKKNLNGSLAILSMLRPDTVIKYEQIKYTYTDTVLVVKTLAITHKEKNKYRQQGVIFAILAALVGLLVAFVIKNYKKILACLSIIV